MKLRGQTYKRNEHKVYETERSDRAVANRGNFFKDTALIHMEVCQVTAQP